MRTAMRRSVGPSLALLLLVVGPASGAGDPAAGASREILSLIPGPGVAEGWSVSGDPATYDRENLFEYLDGGAPRFVGYGFTALVQVRYVREGEPATGVTLDLYDMGTALGAFGIYSSARPPDVPAREWCTEGYRSGGVAAAWKDHLYVHVTADDDRPEVLQLAERLVASVCARAPGDTSPPPLLAVLPREGLVPRSERYVAADLLGHAFLTGGVLATYEIEGRRGELFFCDLGTAPAAREAIARLRAHYAGRGIPVHEGPPIGDAALRHADAVLGPGTVVAAGHHVAGVHGELHYDVQDRLLSRLVERLPTIP
jgi:hypothetical protein